MASERNRQHTAGAVWRQSCAIERAGHIDLPVVQVPPDEAVAPRRSFEPPYCAVWSVPGLGRTILPCSGSLR